MTEAAMVKTAIVVDTGRKGIQVSMKRRILSHHALEIKSHVDHVVRRVAAKGERRVLHDIYQDFTLLSWKPKKQGKRAVVYLMEGEGSDSEYPRNAILER